MRKKRGKNNDMLTIIWKNIIVDTWAEADEYVRNLEAKLRKEMIHKLK